MSTEEKQHEAAPKHVDGQWVDPGLPHHRPRRADVDPKAAKRAERQVAALFGLSILGTIATLVVYFAAEDQWLVFSPNQPGLKLPVFAPASGLSTEDKKRRMLSNVNEVIDSLILQLEPKSLSSVSGSQSRDPRAVLLRENN